MAAQAEDLLSSGVTYIFVGGTTGESYSLTVDERKFLLEEWIRVAGDRITVIANVGCEALADTLDLAQHAELAGAKAIATMSPVFFRPGGLDAIVAWLAEIGKVAPKMPLYYYHLKSVDDFRMDLLLEAVHGRIPSFRGLKYSDPDLHIYGNCVAFADGLYDCLYGKDEQFLGALAMGATGAVGSTYNYMGATINRMIAAYQRGDMAAALVEQRRSQQGVDILYQASKYGSGVNVGKAICTLKGIPVGTPRLPRLPMSPEGLDRLRADLEAIGFFTWS